MTSSVRLRDTKMRWTGGVGMTFYGRCRAVHDRGLNDVGAGMGEGGHLVILRLRIIRYERRAWVFEMSSGVGSKLGWSPNGIIRDCLAIGCTEVDRRAVGGNL